MKYTVIVDEIGIFHYDKWSQVEKSHALTKADFVKHGDEFITHFNKEDFNISKDVKLLESVATAKIFGKKKVDIVTPVLSAVATIIGFILFF